MPHCENKKYKCEECEYATNRKSHLDRHVRCVHRKEKPFKCEECDSSFGQKGQLDEHVRCVHRKEKPFKCEECDSSFGQKGDLDRHVRCVHRGEKPFKCEECDSSFGQKGHLDRHVRFVHRKEKPFKCEECDSSFGQKGDLDRHVRCVHGDGITENELLRQRTYAKKRRDTDPEFKLKGNLRTRVWTAVKSQGVEKCAKTIDLVGCTIQQLKDHLESQFTDGMSWENQGEWHIDHIRPCASYNLLNEHQQKECFHYRNLQPLWATDNISKGSLWEGKRYANNEEAWLAVADELYPENR